MKSLVSGFILLFASSVLEAADGDVDVKLESNFIGDNEQPTVSYFMPWQGIGTPDKLQWNFDSKYDDTLELVDREVMLRSSEIYEQMNLEAKSGNTKK